MQKVVINGSCGRMSQALIRYISSYTKIKIIGTIEHPDHPMLGVNISEVMGADLDNIEDLKVISSNDELFSELVKDADCIIDFSTTLGTMTILEEARKHKKPIIIGTTGFNSEQDEIIEEHAKHIPVGMSYNMSIGLNLLLKLVSITSKILKPDEYDVEIIEKHHRSKLDNPSGTAYLLAQSVANSRSKHLNELLDKERMFSLQTRKNGSIGVSSIRGGGAVGDHHVLFASDLEEIELSHKAVSRDGFCSGAVKFSNWVQDKPPGLYKMKDFVDEIFFSE